MTDREWKPGDVAMVTLRKKNDASIDGGREHVAMRDRVGSWASGTTFGRQIDDDEVKDARPLVVIDPEDREAVERLLSAYYLAVTGEGHKPGHYSELAVPMQAALREFATPTAPRPDEPQGLGAVVEDADGVLWVRVGKELQTPDHWRATSGENLVGWWATWDRIAAVRILSPGVTS
jgi:hypothetical protein